MNKERERVEEIRKNICKCNDCIRRGTFENELFLLERIEKLEKLAMHAIDFIHETPCCPDITIAQKKAYNKYLDSKGKAGL